MRATNKSDRAGRAARWVALATLTAMAAGLAGCVTAPPYSSYGAGYGAGYAAGSNAYGNTSYASSYTSGYGNTYGNGYGSYDPNAPQPYGQQPAPTYSQPNYSPYPSTYPNNGDQAYQAPADNRYGVVEYVEAVPVRGQPSGVGAVLGGVVGGLLGHQVGGGRGNTVATIGGAVAGAMAGNAVEGNTVVRQTYRVTLRLNDNSRVTLTQNNPNGLRAGDRARIENNMAVPY
ncbi:hypothetical protein LMG18102_00086 [Ralstonia mannitolilytica]|uniref:glycine zipper 2TM domain-containing protein n=1 Tax=Ralstonia mannitolilytica TaxID=105219 RepID=UPI0028F59FB6|nr:glycine zipper 2TM domain-containing protein [Ralstonia mannitolilytica]CAJ0683856.1 hypothetical protein LMG18102_00086 [Ralstonia mannitolilytica]